MSSFSKYNNNNNYNNKNNKSYYIKKRDPRLQIPHYQELFRARGYNPQLNDINDFPPLGQQPQQQQQQPENVDESMEIGALEIVEDVEEEQQLGQGKNSLYINPKTLFNITRARKGYISIQTCQKCRDEMYNDKNRFKISNDEEYVTCSIKLCKSCAINNVSSSIKYWTHGASNQWRANNNINNNQMWSSHNNNNINNVEAQMSSHDY
jgi:hypothetical protein